MMALKKSWLVVMAFLMMGQSMPVKAVGPGMFDGLFKAIAITAAAGGLAIGAGGYALGSWAASHPNPQVPRTALVGIAGVAVGFALCAWIVSKKESH